MRVAIAYTLNEWQVCCSYHHTKNISLERMSCWYVGWYYLIGKIACGINFLECYRLVFLLVVNNAFGHLSLKLILVISCRNVRMALYHYITREWYMASNKNCLQPILDAYHWLGTEPISLIRHTISVNITLFMPFHAVLWGFYLTYQTYCTGCVCKKYKHLWIMQICKKYEYTHQPCKW